MITLLPVLMFYYAQIQSGNYDKITIHDYAVVESLIAGVDPKVVTTVIDKESGFDPTEIHVNDMKVGCNSRGLVQIRDCNHPDISNEQAYDPIFAVNFLITNIDKCKTWWAATCPK